MKIILESLTSFAIVTLLILFLNPAHLFMPESLYSLLLVALIITSLLFLGLFWREHPADERDQTHIHKSGRYSFFIGAIILVAGIFFQATSHQIDPWLIYALSGMVLTKLISRIIDHFRN